MPEHLERVEHHHEPEDTHCPNTDCGDQIKALESSIASYGDEARSMSGVIVCVGRDGIIVDPPEMREVANLEANHRLYLPRKVDFASRDERNRRLGREGEQWVLECEQHRLHEAGLSDLYECVEWVSDRLGDGAFDTAPVCQRCRLLPTSSFPPTVKVAKGLADPPILSAIFR